MALGKTYITCISDFFQFLVHSITSFCFHLIQLTIEEITAPLSTLLKLKGLVVLNLESLCEEEPEMPAITQEIVVHQLVPQLLLMNSTLSVEQSATEGQYKDVNMMIWYRSTLFYFWIFRAVSSITGHPKRPLSVGKWFNQLIIIILKAWITNFQAECGCLKIASINPPSTKTSPAFLIAKKARATYKKQRSATVNPHENFLPRGTVGLYLRSS